MHGYEGPVSLLIVVWTLQVSLFFQVINGLKLIVYIGFEVKFFSGFYICSNEE